MKTLITLILAAAVLAACAPAATPAPTAVPTAKPAAPTMAPQPTTAGGSSGPTAAPVQKPTTSPKVTFKIVPGESKVTYEVGETFLNQNNRFAVAIGTTTTISGEIFADKANPPASTIGPVMVDINKFISDSGNRDRQIQNNWLESNKYPQAKFVPNKFESLPASYTDGSEYSFKVSGDLTVKTTTKPVVFEVKAKLTGDTLTGTAATEILMSDFGVGPISILGILNTEDKVKITLSFVARP